ncbi:MAG: cobyrinate a,c-diamide synthase [Alphaproteobacteria bacterium]|jgi:cobyrinic acid a,c-diamide synthase|nr:cobyrinate a,c-diamide synthase [Alphaproteobacteria bacterium]MBT7944201.1 cobyrinate a,c-diamide synthase [Alphaproteobacteria bacterium]
MNTLFISALNKSSGKTTVSIGLARALANQGRTVQPFKKGPDYIDPMWLGRAAGRPCVNLDFHTMSHDDIRATFADTTQGADFALIEGNKGLFDGLDLQGDDSNAALAGLLGAPIVLVIDTRGMTRGIAPVVLGYQAFDEKLTIAGVILNQVGGPRHEGKLRAAVEHYTDVPVLGAIGRHGEMEILERHLGLTPTNESEQADAIINDIARIITDGVDLGALQDAARPALLPAPATAPPSLPKPDIRIAIAQDAAFGFYYPDDLDALKRAGAELVPFDALTDPALPDADGLLIGGGFPETQAAGLEANKALREDIHARLATGMPAYAECGGLMYLARSLTWRGKRFDMVGAIPGDVIQHERPVGRGYVVLRETGDGPWGAMGSEHSDTDIPAHEFHYASLENLPQGQTFAYDVNRGVGIDGDHDGIVIRHLLATFSHQRSIGGNNWADRFAAFVRDKKGF